MTRMWMVDPDMLCRQHLLGEHKELHQAVGSILHGRSLQGHIERGQIEVHSIKSRHKLLAREMIKRGYKHNSPLPDFKARSEGKIDVEANIIELRSRCKDCRRRMKCTREWNQNYLNTLNIEYLILNIE